MQVLLHQRGDGERPYKEIASYALAALTIPTSNAIVERIFSHVTNVKTKKRNLLSIKMLDSILHVRLHLQLKKICCKDFMVTPAMIEKFSSAMYVSNMHVPDISQLDQNVE